MSITYKLNRTCPTCGVRISDKNKSGFCNKHRDRTGISNPFFGKTHSKETREILKIKCKEATTKMWQDEKYVNKVKNGLKSDKNKQAHTSEEFRKKQSEHAKKQMKDFEQLELRKNTMKQSWEEGKLKYNPYHSPNFSKDEIRFGEMLKEELKENGKFLERGFKIERIDLPKHYFVPDFKYKNYIIEFDGDFWHAHNKEDSEIVHHNVTAKEIREKDELKNKTYERYGYTVIRIWRSDFLDNENEVVKNISNILLENLN